MGIALHHEVRKAPRKAEPITILLVDDDPDCRLLIREAISQCKISNMVYEVPDGQAALDFIFQRGEYADAPRPGLIYLDIEMPGMSGQDVLKVIKSSPDHRHIPIVMMTGVSDEAQMELAARNGANSYTIKPANAEQFLTRDMSSAEFIAELAKLPGSAETEALTSRGFALQRPDELEHLALDQLHTADMLVLMRSDLRPGGAVYTPQATATLIGSAD